jgi:Mg-chelatase subunit ChlI
MQQPDEEAMFRTEVFATHVPDENEEWLKFELSRLTQCTRIFPPEPKKTTKDSEGKDVEEGKEDNEEDKEEQEDEEEGEKKKDKDGKDKDKENKEESKSNKAKSASYEEIMFQVFLQDRRQTMRMRCPLPNRAKTDDNSNFLPPLEPPVSSRSTASSLVRIAFI